MEGHHYRIVVVTKFLAALAERPSRIALGYHQLYQALNTNGEDQQVVHCPTSSAARARRRSRGPWRSSIRRTPVVAGRSWCPGGCPAPKPTTGFHCRAETFA